jgi:riboflavin kinase/FMN adenylyltransferase
MAFAPGFAVPRHGVYASQAHVEGEWRPSVTNIGVAPTVRNSAEGGRPPQARSETHVLGYEGDLYGQCVPVRLLRFLRPEKKFADLAALKRQIAMDAREAWKEG